MTTRSWIYRCGVLTFSGPQTAGVRSEWRFRGQPIDSKELSKDDMVGLWATVEPSAATWVGEPGTHLRFDILEKDLVGDDLVETLRTPEAPLDTEAWVPLASDRTPKVIDLGAKDEVEGKLREFIVAHPEDFSHHVLILRPADPGESLVVATWWQLDPPSDPGSESELYFLFHAEGGGRSFDDRSETVIDVAQVAAGASERSVPPDVEDANPFMLYPELDAGVAPAKTEEEEGKPGSTVNRNAGTAAVARSTPPPPQAGAPPKSVWADYPEFQKASQRWPFQEATIHYFYPRERVQFAPKLADPLVTSDPGSRNLRDAVLMAEAYYQGVGWALVEGPLPKTAKELRQAVHTAYYAVPIESEAKQEDLKKVRGADGQMRVLGGLPTAVEFQAGKHWFRLRLIRVPGDSDTLVFPEDAFKFLVWDDEIGRTGVGIAGVEAHLVKMIKAGLQNPGSFADSLHGVGTDAWAAVDPIWRETALKALIDEVILERDRKTIARILQGCKGKAEIESHFKALKNVGGEDKTKLILGNLNGGGFAILASIGKAIWKELPPEQHRISQGEILQIFEKRVGLTRGLLKQHPGGLVEVVQAELEKLTDEIEVAARTLVQTLVRLVKDVWELIFEFDKFLAAMGQLAGLVVTFAKSAWTDDPKAHEEAMQIMEAFHKKGQEAVLHAFAGAKFLGLEGDAAKYIEWTLVWELASMFIGLGEMSAVVKGLRLGERASSLGRLARMARAVDQPVRVANKVVHAVAHTERAAGRAMSIFDARRLVAALPDEVIQAVLKHSGTIDFSKLRRLDQLEGGSDAVKAVQRLQEAVGVVRDLERKIGTEIAPGIKRLDPEITQGLGNLLREAPIKDVVKALDGLPDDRLRGYLRAMNQLLEAC